MLGGRPTRDIYNYNPAPASIPPPTSILRISLSCQWVTKCLSHRSQRSHLELNLQTANFRQDVHAALLSPRNSRSQLFLWKSNDMAILGVLEYDHFKRRLCHTSLLRMRGPIFGQAYTDLNKTMSWCFTEQFGR